MAASAMSGLLPVMVEVAYPSVCRDVANRIKTSSEGFRDHGHRKSKTE
jgi:hypothetical protein